MNSFRKLLILSFVIAILLALTFISYNERKFSLFISYIPSLSNNNDNQQQNKQSLIYDLDGKCKYTSWGRSLTADSKGLLCNFKDIDMNMCCNEENAIKTSCELCSSEYECCEVYEHCVSCCIQNLLSKSSLKKKDLINLLNEWSSNQNIKKDILEDYKSNINIPYDWCIIKCRTSSNSIIHQNRYRSKFKYCYGKKGSPLITH